MKPLNNNAILCHRLIDVIAQQQYSVTNHIRIIEANKLNPQKPFTKNYIDYVMLNLAPESVSLL